MNVYSSNEKFTVGGIPYAGIPILVDCAGHIVEVALRFFVEHVLPNARARDPKTWLAYGQYLYDYFGFLEAKGLRWDFLPEPNCGDIAPISHYVRWCDATIGNSPSYINDKVGLITRLYKWAHSTGRIAQVPYVTTEVSSAHTSDGYLAHASGRGGKVEVTNLHLTESTEPIRVLTRAQVDLLLHEVRNPTHCRVIHLGLSAGLRAEELATFPASYVKDCSRLSPKVKSVAVRLDSSEMDTKNRKSRSVRISVKCMNALWQYKSTTRERLRALNAADEHTLFLTRFGAPFVSDGFVQPLARIGASLGFHLHPHMLRHTFATHTLAALEDLKRKGRLRGEPLLLVRDLLGHASVATTSRYLHFLEEIDDAYGTQYQAEIDEIAERLLGKDTVA
ncbi:site-specific integrase [Ralstonia solanacearum]|nr:site-specific integrase [Ralstonia solanacearum]